MCECECVRYLRRSRGSVLVFLISAGRRGGACLGGEEVFSSLNAGTSELSSTRLMSHPAVDNWTPHIHTQSGLPVPLAVCLVVGHYVSLSLSTQKPMHTGTNTYTHTPFHSYVCVCVRVYTCVCRIKAPLAQSHTLLSLHAYACL